MSLNLKIIIFSAMVAAFLIYITYNVVLLLFPYMAMSAARRRHLENEVAYLVKLFGSPPDDFRPGFVFTLASFFNVKIGFVLRRLAYRIFEHMQLDAGSVEMNIIKINSSRFEEGSSISGTFSSSDGIQVIEIFVRKDYSLPEIAAVMCHECTHYFMYSHMLSEAQGGFNENLTDIAAVFLGFSSIMLRGYDEKIRKVKTSDGILFGSSKLGYISKTDILYIKKIIKKFKRSFKNI